MTMTVNLGEALERSVEDLVANGRYGSRSEVLREGVRLVEEREQQFAKLKRMLEEGLADVEAGRLYDLDEVFDPLIAKYQRLADEDEQTEKKRA